ncbi:MAG TPA: hypothetical protein PLA92_08630 [Fimbriimonadaceae bacterium]|nr:hypothetical protein [Fimbriimonadaceae bacterium]
MHIELELGQLLITPTAQSEIDPADVFEAIQRHATGDWGELCEEDCHENELCARNGFRVFSAYSDRHGSKFWIITEADRSTTTVLLPNDY